MEPGSISIGMTAGAAAAALAAVFLGMPALAADLPDCAASPDFAGEGLHADCRVVAEHAGAPWTYEFAFTSVDGYSEDVVVTVTGPDGAEIDRFTGYVDGAHPYPAVTDLNGDGVPEVLIPEISGNVNTATVLYAWDAAAGRHVQAGYIELSAEPIGGGLIRAWSHGSCCSGAEVYYGLHGTELVTEFTVEFTAQLEGVTGLAAPCVIVDGGGLAAAGYDSEEGRAALCARDPYREN